jgi:uncharacterized protein YdaU (DUF1376 family)
MNGLPYYKAYPRDFIEGTIGMDLETKGAYRLVIDLIYMQGGNLPDDARYISGLLGCTMRRWNAIRQTLLDAGKLRTNGGVLTNERAVIELETLRKLQEKQRENGSQPKKNKGLEKPRLNHTEPEPDITEEANASSPTQKRGQRLPDEWRLPREWGEWALSEGWPESVVRAEAEKFKDHWISSSGRNATKRDWKAAWRNWMRNSRAPKVVNGDGYERTSKSADKLRAFIAGAD